MRVVFTVNITEVFDERVSEDGDSVPATDEHYALFPAAFAEQMKDSEHELILENGVAIMYEMEDIEGVK